MSSAARVLAVAAAQVGTRENPPGSNNVLYTRWAGMVGQPWCDIFVSWCLAAAGLAELEGFHAYTPEHFAAFRARGRGFPGTAGIAPGDVVFYDFPGGPDRISHTGFVETVNPDGSFVAIEGNTDEAGGRTGGRVMRHTRRNYVVGYGRPAYTTGDDVPLDRNDLFAIGVTVKASIADLQILERLDRLERRGIRTRKGVTALMRKAGVRPADAQKANDPDADLLAAPPDPAELYGTLELEPPAPPRPPVDLEGDDEAPAPAPAARGRSPKVGRR